MRGIVLFLLLALPVGAAEPLAVPFVAQKHDECGPAALTMLARFYGQPVAPDAVAQAITLPEIHGTLTTDLAAYARRFNLWVRQYPGSPADLREKLAAGVPLLVLGKFGAQYHYFIVLGIDEFAQTVTVHSGQRADLVMPQEQFWRVWDRADRWTLLVCPPDRAAWHLSAAENNDLGVFLERTGQLAAAAGHYQLAGEMAPANSYFAMNLGNALLKQKLVAEAAAAFARAAKIDPENADVLNNLANAYGEMNANLDEGVELCHRAIKLWPSHQAYYLDTLGGILVKQGRRAEAIAAFEQAVAATTDRQTALHAAIQQHLDQARALKER